MLNSSHEVFILGAGFSKAVANGMPLLEELSTDVQGRIGVLPPPLSSLGNNIELWLSYLSQSQPWLKEQHNLENRALFLRITEQIKFVIDDATAKVIQQTCPPWLTDLSSWWHKKQSRVITFNYDTLVERAAATISNGLDNSGLGLEHIYPVPMAGLLGRNILGGGAGLPSFQLYKLHGSTNWYYSGAATFYGERLYEVDPISRTGWRPN